MQTRLERNHIRKKVKNRNKVKFIILFALFLLLLIGIDKVNENIIQLECFSNPTLIQFNLNRSTVDLFGITYNIDLEKANNLIDYIKDRISGLFVLHKGFYLL